MDLVPYCTQPRFISVSVTWNRALEVLHNLATNFSASSKTFGNFLVLGTAVNFYLEGSAREYLVFRVLNTLVDRKTQLCLRDVLRTSF